MIGRVSCVAAIAVAGFLPVEANPAYIPPAPYIPPHGGYAPPPPPVVYYPPSPPSAPPPKTVYYPPSPPSAAPDYPKKPCCLRNLKSGPYGAHVFKPKVNDLLFDMSSESHAICPIKDDKAICNAVAERFANDGTALTPTTDYHPRKIKLHYDDDVRAYGEGRERIIDDKWISDTWADVVVVSQSCCFNIYGGVGVGDYLSATCENDILGDPNELYKLLDYSFITAGQLQIECPPGIDCVFDQAVIVGTDLTLILNYLQFCGTPARRLQSNPDVAVPDTPDTVEAAKGPGQSGDMTLNYLGGPDFQYWDGIGLQVGGQLINQVSGDIDLTAGDFYQIFKYDDESDVDRGEGVYEPISQEENDRSRLVAATRICALSRQLASMKPNIKVGVDEDGYAVIDCFSQKSVNCVVEMSKDVFEKAEAFTIKAPNGSQVIINVSGKSLSTDYETEPAPSEAVSIIWNFPEAQLVNINALGLFAGHIVAPKAAYINVGVTFTSTHVLAGNPNSMTMFRKYFFGGSGSREATPALPLTTTMETPAEVTLCTCLCKDEDEVKIK